MQLKTRHLRKPSPVFGYAVTMFSGSGANWHWNGRRARFAIPLLMISYAFVVSAPLQGQQSVCELFKDLTAADSRQLILTGDLIISRDVAALGAADCENRYISRVSGTSGPSRIWPTAVRLRPSPVVPAKQIQQLQEAAAKADDLRRKGKTLSASATFAGRLRVSPADDLPAELTFDSVDDIVVEALPDASQLPVIPICELFQNLPAWRGKRIAVRGKGGGNSEGYWIGDGCEGAFYTDGYRWPVSLNYGLPAWYSGSTAPLAEVRKPSEPPKGYESLKGRYNVVRTATYVGRLRMKDQYTAVCRVGGDYLTFGFGHFGAAAAELVVEAVMDVELTPNTQTEADEEEEKLCSPSNLDSLCTTATTLSSAVSQNCVNRTREFLTKDGIDSKDGNESLALRTAIVNGNEAIVRLLLDAGAPVNPSKKTFWAPLVEAGHRGRIGILKLLLKKGAIVDDPDDRGATYLAGGGFLDPRVVKILLEAGANPNARDRGETALMEASDYGFEDSVKILIAYHADVNLVDNKGRTALMHAAAGKYVDAIPHLLAAGADLSVRDFEGKTALDVAKASRNSVAEEFLSTAMGTRQ